MEPLPVAKTDHSPDHAREHARNGGCCYPGNPGRMPAAEKRHWIEAKARELADGGFDRLPVWKRDLLLQCAKLLLQPRRKREDEVRKINTVSRLLALVHDGQAAASFDEALQW